MERFRTCAFLDIVTKGPLHQSKRVLENMCKPFCEYECPIKLPVLEFTGDSVVPYVEELMIEK